MEIKFDIKEEKTRRFVFYGLVVISFLAIFVYNVFTPAMTDDLSYKKIVEGADSFLDLLRQEKHQYMTWTGRSVNHMVLRCFLSMDKWVFNIFNSLAFVALSLFMYYNIERRKNMMCSCIC